MEHYQRTVDLYNFTDCWDYIAKFLFASIASSTSMHYWIDADLKLYKKLKIVLSLKTVIQVKRLAKREYENIHFKTFYNEVIFDDEKLKHEYISKERFHHFKIFKMFFKISSN